jgi:hypothetical protein
MKAMNNPIRGAKRAPFAQPMKAARRAALLALALAAPLAAAAADQFATLSTPRPNRSPLVDKVRAATAQYQDINVPLTNNEGWTVRTPCVSGPNEGAMGVHLVNLDRVFDGVLDPTQPEALIYEPMAGGEFRLVGVEFIAAASTISGAAALDGHLLNFVDEPNRYGLPAFYEMHVWAWEDNPKGNFADWNTNVSCDKQPSTN